MLYSLLAKGYFFFFDSPAKENNENKDFYGITIAHNKPIPYEIRNKNEKVSTKKKEEKKEKSIISDRSEDIEMKRVDYERYDLVDNK